MCIGQVGDVARINEGRKAPENIDFYALSLLVRWQQKRSRRFITIAFPCLEKKARKSFISFTNEHNE